MSSTEAAAPAARRPTAAGVCAVAAAELRRRRRTSRWVRALALWCALLAGVLLVATALLPLLTPGTVSYSGPPTGGLLLASGARPAALELPWLEVSAGPTLFAVLAFTILAGGVVVGAALAATASTDHPSAAPAERALGAYLASWLAACAFVVVGVPFLALTLVAGAGPAASVVRVVLVAAALVAVACGIARGLVTPGRPAARVVRWTVGTFVVVTLATPVLVGLTRPLVTTTGPVQVFTRLASSPTNTDNPTCGFEPAVRRITHTERTWWLQAVNPVVLVADAAGTPDPGPYARSAVSHAVDPLDGLRHGVRMLRAGSPLQLDECYGAVSDLQIEETVAADPFWGWGLAFWAALGAGGLVLSVRRVGV